MYLLKDEKNPLARVPTIVVGAAAVGSVPEGALGEEWRDHQPVDQPASQPASRRRRVSHSIWPLPGTWDIGTDRQASKQASATSKTHTRHSTGDHHATMLSTTPRNCL